MIYYKMQNHRTFLCCAHKYSELAVTATMKIAIEIHCRANTILCFTEIRKKNSDELFGGKKYPIEVERTTKNKTMFVIWLVTIKPYNFLSFVFGVRPFLAICFCFFDDFFFFWKPCENLRYRLAVLIVNSKRRALWHILAYLSPFDFSFYQKSSSVLERIRHKNNQSSNNYCSSAQITWASVNQAKVTFECYIQYLQIWCFSMLNSMH